MSPATPPRGLTVPAERPGRLAVGVVGAGRVGAVLGAALSRAGHAVVAAAAVSQASVARAQALLPGVPLLPPPEVVAGADLVLLTVPDDALPDLVAGLAGVGVVRRGQLLVHSAARHGVAVLEPATGRGALPLALHPAMTFTGSTVDLARLAGCCFAVTAPDALLPIAEALVVEMGAEPQVVAETARPLYAAALALGADALAAFVTEAAELLRRAGVEQPGRLLAPLAGAALDTALRSGDAALSGPAARGDAGTVGANAAVLGASSPPALAAYLAGSRLTAGRALAAGRLAPASAAALLDVLAGGPDPGHGGPGGPGGHGGLGGHRPGRG